ncbi:intradiol ring-cleavage dioxygenase [Segetibacter sp. 3557_3]|uniref:dioxygenase family protein n=1 Tax=Segetibacter sp. 3557_3 TaxID=2547429 RepID=UPI001058C139|nr:intradiol ring-cleavage dioxygenase [Segetibacter sp. 3557_3]TDH21643.1 intradiol ring-cleavage dioxygenase [Segetibacter sp. 3557_3]
MQAIRKSVFLLITLSLLVSCNGTSTAMKDDGTTQTRKKVVGGGCDGCELMFVGMPKNIDHIDTSAGWNEKGQKLAISGAIYKADGKTPAPNVILYYWQTDNSGVYSPVDGMAVEARSHGHIRGWIKTNPQGRYSIYTIRPAPYRDRSSPAHIHISLKEPTINNEYYIDDFQFDDDQLLTNAIRQQADNRGGSGILKTVKRGNLELGTRNIILGLNIPGYPR